MNYETPYYLAPQKSGVRQYALLREALTKTKRAGVATFVMRNKAHLAILRVSGDAIILNRIRFHEEIRATTELDLPSKMVIKPAELKMAITLVDQLSGKFDITGYKNIYSESLMKVINAKAKGKETVAPVMKILHSKAKDLMEQLKASIETKRKKAS